MSMSGNCYSWDGCTTSNGNDPCIDNPGLPGCVPVQGSIRELDLDGQCLPVRAKGSEEWRLVESTITTPRLSKGTIELLTDVRKW